MEIGKLIADKNLENDGKWFTFSEAETKDGVDVNKTEFKIAYINNRDYQRRLNKISQKARARSRNRDLAPGMDTEVMCEAMAGTILQDWHGFTDDGKPFPFNEANAKAFLMQSLEVRNFVLNEASDISNFQSAPEVSEGALTSAPADKRELKSGAGVGAKVG